MFRCALFASILLLAVPGLHAGEKVSIKLEFNGYKGLIGVNRNKVSRTFECRGTDTTLLLDSGTHELYFGLDKNPDIPTRNVTLKFTIAAGGIQSVSPKEAAVSNGFTLTLQPVQCLVTIDRDSGITWYPSTFFHQKKAFHDRAWITLLPGITMAIDNGSYWDTSGFMVDTKHGISMYSYFHLTADASGQLVADNAEAVRIIAPKHIQINTSNIWICPCHFGNKAYGVQLGITADTLTYWQLTPIIAGLANRVTVFNQQKEPIEENIFMTPEKGVLKRKDMLRLKSRK